jgi:hypothetical protein
MEHTLFPIIPESAWDSHKSPFSIFCEAHKGLELSDEEIKTKNKLRDIEDEISDYIIKYTENLSNAYKRLLNGDIKSAQNAIRLMSGFMWGCKGAISHSVGLYPAEEAKKEGAYLAEKIDNWFEYYSKLAAEADNAAHGIAVAAPPPDTQPPENKVTLPPVIQAVLSEGLLDTPPVNGKYLKKGDKKDTDIIEWIFDLSGYGDSLTTELYMQYIQTHCKTTTIQDYITRNK